MINDLKETFHSTIKALEIFYVLNDVKPVARILVHDHHKENIENKLIQLKLIYLFSDFKIKKEDAAGYSDKGVISQDPKEEGYGFCYIGKQQEKIKEVKHLEKDQHHKALGIALGYPECCCEFFQNNFEEQSKKSNDYTLLTLNNSEGSKFPFQNNIAARHFDHTLLSHFPCNFNCKPSLEMANKNLELIKKQDPVLANEIETALKNTIIYSESQGVTMLKNPLQEGNKLYYKGIQGTQNNQLYHMLKMSDFIEIIHKNKITISGLEIKNIGVMIFR